MVFLSVRFTRKKALFALIFAVCAALAAICLASSAARAQPETLPAGGSDAERVGFLARFGWEVSDTPIETQEVLIPQEFDRVYTPYNELQLAQGFDLTPYRGMTVTRVTYAVLNYPGGAQEVRADLLVSQGKIIGGDVCSVALGGFMHGFDLGGTGLPFGSPVESGSSEPLQAPESADPGASRP